MRSSPWDIACRHETAIVRCNSFCHAEGARVLLALKTCLGGIEMRGNAAVLELCCKSELNSGVPVICELSSHDGPQTGSAKIR